MRNRKTAWILAVGLGMTAFAGCGSEEMKNYEQAAQDLEAEDFDAALQEYEAAISAGVKLAQSYRGAGVANLRLGNYEQAIEDFNHALNSDKVGKALKKDILSYRAAAYLKTKAYDEAMADCQSIAESYDMDADLYFLTGKVALAMDSYEEASADFEQAYGEDATYDMALRIYGVYLDEDMEADGTRYLEAALSSEAKDAKDHCDRGRVYYYMEDYSNAKKELLEASKKDNTEALLLLGMVYLAQDDVDNAKAMYTQYISAAGDSAKGYNGLALCDIRNGDYDSALDNITKGLPTATTDEMQSLLFNEIVTYEKKLDFATALTKVKEYIDMFPEDSVAKKELAFLKTRTSSEG